MVTVSEKPEARDEVPPSYSESAVTDPPLVFSQGDSRPRPGSNSPTNYLTIVRENQSIKGSYTIDPSLPKPPGTTPPTGPDGKPLNVRLATRNGSIDAAVHIIHSGDVNGPTRLETASTNGSVTFAVHDSRVTRFRLHAATTNGSITLRIPRTYNGAVSTYTKNGALVFSSAVKARLTTISEHGPEGRYFIGDYKGSGSGYENDEMGREDYIRVESENGRVHLEFVDGFR